MKKGNLANKEMLKLMVFFLMLFAPITVNAAEPADTADSDGSSEEANETKNASNESETITDTTATFTGSYDTEEEANNRKDEKETEYQEAGYENIQSEITSVTTSDEEEITIDRTFDDKEEAKSLLEVFLDTYEDATGKVTEVRTDEVIETTEGTTPYDTEEAAQTALDNYIADNETDAYYFEGEVVGPKETGEYTNSEEISEHFDSEDAANEHIANLKNEGYIVEKTDFTNDTETNDLSIDNVKYDTEEAAEDALNTFKDEHLNATWDEDATGITVVEAGTVYEAQLVTANLGEHVVTDSLFVINRHGHDIYVWTLNELSVEEIAEFKKTYKEMDHESTIDHSMHNVDNGIFIHGLDNDFLSGNHKLFTVEQKEDGTWVAVLDSGSTSHVIYGAFEPVVQYVVNAVGTETVELESGTLTGTKKKAIEGYYFNTTKKKKQWHLTATATDTVETTTYYLTVKADIPQEKEQDKKETPQQTNVVNPQTSDSVIKYATLLTLSVGISVLGCLALRSNRKKFN